MHEMSQSGMQFSSAVDQRRMTPMKNRCKVRVHAADGDFFLRRGALLSDPHGYFLEPPEISAAVAFVLGGETAIPGGECASEASSGLAAAGVIDDT